MAYFDNAATTYPKPECVYSFMDEFYLNHGKEKSLIKNVTGRNLLTGEDINETLSLAAYDVAVICKQS